MLRNVCAPSENLQVVFEMCSNRRGIEEGTGYLIFFFCKMFHRFDQFRVKLKKNLSHLYHGYRSVQSIHM